MTGMWLRLLIYEKMKRLDPWLARCFRKRSLSQNRGQHHVRHRSSHCEALMRFDPWESLDRSSETRVCERRS